MPLNRISHFLSHSASSNHSSAFCLYEPAFSRDLMEVESHNICPFVSDLFYVFLSFFILFLAALGPRCCPWAFSSCDEWRLLFTVALWLLILEASLVSEHKPYTSGLSNYGTWAQLLRGMGDLPRGGIEPMSLHWQADS